MENKKDIDIKEVGRRIKEVRILRSITQKEVANLIKVAESTISRYETGKIYELKIPIIHSIAKVLNVDVLYLLLKKDTMGEYDSSVKENNYLIKQSPGIYQLTKTIPMIGTIAAGLPLLAVENIEDYFYIDTRLKADFALKIKGDSMIDAGIYQDDIVFIKSQDCLENGEIGAILIEDEATLKRFYKDNGTIILQAENDNYKPMVFTNGNIRILGKLVAVLNII